MMTERTAYTYITLRYIHDITTQEFVNVGVVLYAPAARFIGARCLTHSSRLSNIFPGFNVSYFASLLSHVQAQFDIINTSLHGAPKATKAKSLEELVTSVLPKDDSSLQWDAVGSGLTNDPRATLTKLFDRLVAKYEEGSGQMPAVLASTAVDTLRQELRQARAKIEELTDLCRRVESNNSLILACLSQFLQQAQYREYKPAFGRHAAGTYAPAGGNRLTIQNSAGMIANVAFANAPEDFFFVGEGTRGNYR